MNNSIGQLISLPSDEVYRVGDGGPDHAVVLHIRNARCETSSMCTEDPKIIQLLSVCGADAMERWPIEVVWFASYLVYLGTAYGTKTTYRFSINTFNIIFSSLEITSPIANSKSFPPKAGGYVYGACKHGIIQSNFNRMHREVSSKRHIAIDG